MVIQERYNYRPMGVNDTLNINGHNVSGFVCTTSGTLTLTDGSGTAVLTAFPVTAGTTHRFPLILNQINGTVALAGGASGCLLV